MKNSLRLGLVICLLFSIIACNNSNKEKDSVNKRNNKELILAVGGEANDGFDPTTGWGRYGSPLFQSTLLKYNPDFELENDLATEYNVSDDGLEWEVTIKDNILFSDGSPLTIDDVVFTYKTAKDSKSVVDLTNVEKIEKSGERTIKFILKERNSTFVFYLFTVGIVPEKYYDNNYKENPIGSGPYVLVEWSKGQQLIVKANPNYYGATPFFEKLTFLFLSEDASFAAAKAGEVHVASVPASFASREVKNMKLIQSESVDNRGVVLPFVPNEGKTNNGAPIGNDVTSDMDIRKAMNIAVDREKLVEGVLNGYGAPAYTAVDHLPWWNADTKFNDNLLDDAKEMLNKAGWIEKDNGIREKNGLEAAFTLYYPSNDDTRQSLSIAFADMMKPLGIKVETKGKSWNEIYRVMHSNAVMLGLGSHTPLELYNAYSEHKRGESLNNVNYYANKKVDEYFEKALRAETQEEAYEYWKKSQWDGETGSSFLGDAPWVWLVNLDHMYFIDEDLEIGKQKIHPHGHGWPITDFIETWHWKE